MLYSDDVDMMMSTSSLWAFKVAQSITVSKHSLKLVIAFTESQK